VKDLVEKEFAFSIALKYPDTLTKIKFRCDCTNEMEISGILMIEEMTMIEDNVLRIEGKFGEIDLSITRYELETLLSGGEKK
jgi:hypothetical protein